MKTNFKISEKFVPLFILLLCALSYGSTLNLGYFWDDWPVLWNFHAMGAAGVYQSYAMDRPIHGYLLGQIMQLVGETPLVWHLSAVLVLAAAVCLCWLALRQLWADHPLENAMIAAFIAVYPGFTQQSIPLVYILLVFGCLAIWALSIWLMLAACLGSRPRWLFVLLASLLAFLHLAITEYFVGLELLRPLMLVIVVVQDASFNLKSDWRRGLKQIFLWWLPYLAALLAFLFFRLVLFHSGRDVTDSGSILQKIQASPLIELSHRISSILTDPFEVTVVAWLQPFNVFLKAYTLFPRFWWQCSAVIVLVSLSTLAFFHFLKRSQPVSGAAVSAWEKQAFWLGLAGVLLAGLPIWGIGRDVILGVMVERYSFPFMLGSGMLLASLISMAARQPTLRLALAAVLIGMAVGFHIWNTHFVYQVDWLNQKNFFSQLSQRVPGLQPGTSLWVVKDPNVMAMEVDYGLSMPLNLIYGPSQHSPDLQYWAFLLTNEYLEKTGIFRSGPLPAIQHQARNLSFTGSARQTVVVWFAPQSCLKVIDPGQPELSEVYTIPSIGHELARIDPIMTTPGGARFPVNLFGAQLVDWCSYFEQADLARQVGDWQTAARLGDEAAQKGLTPGSSAEWMPFIEAYVRLGRLEDAARLINLVQASPLASSKLMICGFVARVSPGVDAPTQKFLAGIGQQAVCAAP